MPNQFQIIINSQPATIYMMSHTLMTVDYKGKKVLMCLDKDLEWHCSVKELEEMEEITKAVEGFLLGKV